MASSDADKNDIAVELSHAVAVSGGVGDHKRYATEPPKKSHIASV
jgi:hypothetical protein